VRLSAEIRYDADPEQVFAMLIDPEFQEAKCVATGSLEHEVDVSPDDDGSFVVISRRSMRTDLLPEFARAFVGSTVRLRETQRWQPAGVDGTRAGSVLVEIEGLPVRFTGSMALTPENGGCHQPIEGDIKASIPLLGGRIEKAAEPAVLAAIRVEQRTGTEWLAART
jgi:uncharacterized protein YndB with AHSA1/START domain